MSTKQELASARRLSPRHGTALTELGSDRAGLCFARLRAAASFASVNAASADTASCPQGPVLLQIMPLSTPSALVGRYLRARRSWKDGEQGGNPGAMARCCWEGARHSRTAPGLGSLMLPPASRDRTEGYSEETLLGDLPSCPLEVIVTPGKLQHKRLAGERTS